MACCPFSWQHNTLKVGIPRAHSPILSNYNLVYLIHRICIIYRYQKKLKEPHKISLHSSFKRFTPATLSTPPESPASPSNHSPAATLETSTRPSRLSGTNSARSTHPRPDSAAAGCPILSRVAAGSPRLIAGCHNLTTGPGKTTFFVRHAIRYRS